ncbi:MAG: hypothetical protein ABID09_01320 [Candidatus Omnitrophota bacterium]
MNKKMLFAVVLCLALASNVLAYEGSKGGSSCGHGKGRTQKDGLSEKFYEKAHFLMSNAEELGLSDEQVSKIKDIKLKTKRDLILKKAEIEVVALDIDAMMHEDVINKVDIDKLIDKKYDLKKENAKLLVGSYATLKGLITKEQKDKMKEIWKSCKKSKK